MKIAIPSTSPDLSGEVEHTLGSAAYMLVIETTDMTVEAIEALSPASGPGAGIKVLTLVLEKGAQVVLADYIAPHVAAVLEEHTVTVKDQVRGSVAEALAAYMHADTFDRASGDSARKAESVSVLPTWRDALTRGGRQVLTLLPMLFGVILLVGLFQAVVSREALLTLFSGSMLQDTVIGGALGSILAGNPVNSYVIGDNLLQAGVGLSAVTAFMMAWVNVGILQLPAEAASLGWRFSLVRNGAGLLVSVIMGVMVSWMIGGAG